MIENLVKASTCQVFCGEELGTGFLVSDKVIITARHCVLNAIESDEEITLTFHEINSCMRAYLINHDADLDICLLSVDTELDLEPVKFDFKFPREGAQWYANGFPVLKRESGHRINGNILQTLSSPKNKIDIDLTIKSNVQLSKYNGFSGSALICNDLCVGILRLKLGKTLGAISSSQVASFLEANNVKSKSINTVSSLNYIERSDFQYKFESKFKNSDGEYYFLEGANGIGKSTFCENYKPLDQTVSVLGSYSLSTNEGDLGVSHQVQPGVFYDWLLTTITILLSGKSPRIEEVSASSMIKKTSSILEEYSKYCISRKRKGVIFIDGINEGIDYNEELLKKLVGLLPLTLPKGVSIVFTASNFNNVAHSLNGKIQKSNIEKLSGLNRGSMRAYCWNVIDEDKVSASLISLVCDKAQGHPLYLRYLIEFINSSADIDELQDFPEIGGTIANYYEQIWNKLLLDPEAIHLLAIICRLRWGLEISDFSKILNLSESNILVPTLSRVRHLLENANDTTIYHLSFKEFIKEKTFNISDQIEKRISDFCIENKEISYCAINSVFHSLRSGLAYHKRTIELCNQIWVDNCVLIGIKPDTLLFDIEDVFILATKTGTILEIIRILLLSHRIGFRYNYIFSQSAHLVCESLIALNKPKEAYHQIIRFGSLNIYIEEALHISILFIKNGNKNQAKQLLDLIDESLEEILTSEGHHLKDYMKICEARMRTLVLISLINGDVQNQSAFRFMAMAINVIRQSKNDLPEEVIIGIATELQSIILSFSLCFKDNYTSLSTIKKRVNPLPPNMLEINISSIFGCLNWLNSYRKIKTGSYLDELFNDIKEMVSSKMFLDSKTPSKAVDTLIQLGAPTHLISLMVDKKKLPEEIIALTDNGVDLDYEKINQNESQWRVAAFLEDDFKCPDISEIVKTNFITWIDGVYKVLLCCEGKARRLKADNGDSIEQEKHYEYFVNKVLSSLSIELKDRILWEYSYSIPEEIFPVIYEKISELYIDCFPEKIPDFLKYINDNFETQLGIYSEGFLLSIFNIINELSHQKFSIDETDLIIEILFKLKNFIVDNIQNRQELIPNLLKLLPLLIKQDCNEVATDVYKLILKYSMGPNWYKEDQFSLLITLVKNSQIFKYDNEISMEVAAYLEKASGEVTFQRFVRYEKSSLIEELVSKQRYTHAFQYFKQQTCGNLQELYTEATAYNIDRVGLLKGNRFPGGALEEQDAIHKIVSGANEVDWRLRWSLLEIYTFGGDRFLNRYAKEFGNLVNLEAKNDNLLSEMNSRLKLNVLTELSINNKMVFLKTFKSTLNKRYHGHFLNLFNRLPNAIKDIDSNEDESISRNTPDSGNSDKIFMRGTFGSKGSIQTSKTLLNEALTNFKKGNKNNARGIAVKALQEIQIGGWSIWRNMGDTVNPIMEIIDSDELNPDQICHLYSPLLCEERFEARWALAEQLVDKFASRLNKKNTLELSKIICEHIKSILGDTTREKESFRYLIESSQNNASDEFIDLIIWLIDHPHLIRKDKAVDAVSWLMEKEPRYCKNLISLAYSKKIGYAPDAICGVLDLASVSNPLEVWRNLEEELNLKLINKDCNHVSRLTSLKKIAERASRNGSVSASDFLSNFPQIVELAETQKEVSRELVIPIWLASFQLKYHQLFSEEFFDDEVIKSFLKEVANVCEPLEIEVAWELEELVSNCFGSTLKGALNRWDAKLHYALNVALYKTGRGKYHELIERSMRVYNPNFLEKTKKTESTSKSDEILQLLDGALGYENIILNDEMLLLNYQELINKENLKRPIQVEISTSLTSRYNGFAPIPLSNKALFPSNQHYSELNSNVPDSEVCYRVNPKSVYKGIFTPAIPTTKFISLSNTQTDDFKRENWRDGRSSNSKCFGRPIIEGCSLSINLNKLVFPNDYKIVWFFKVNDQVINVFSKSIEELK